MWLDMAKLSESSPGINFQTENSGFIVTIIRKNRWAKCSPNRIANPSTSPNIQVTVGHQLRKSIKQIAPIFDPLVSNPKETEKEQTNFEHSCFFMIFLKTNGKETDLNQSLPLLQTQKKHEVLPLGPLWAT